MREYISIQLRISGLGYPKGSKLIVAGLGSPLGEGRRKKIGRASLLASHRPSKSLPHETRREPRPPDLRWFCPGGLWLQRVPRIRLLPACWPDGASLKDQ